MDQTRLALAATRRSALSLLAALGVTASVRPASSKKNKKRRCPNGEGRCPQGFPSRCCAAGTTCCDTDRCGCCPA